LCGLRYADQLGVCARGQRVGGEGGDAVGMTKAGDPVLGEPQAGGGAPLLVCQHDRDRPIVVVSGEPAHKRDGVFRCAARVGLSLAAQLQRLKLGGGAPLPSDRHVDRAGVAIDSHADLVDQRAQQELAVALAGSGRLDDGPQVGACVLQPLQLVG
jgi:hypothetical protein